MTVATRGVPPLQMREVGKLRLSFGPHSFAAQDVDDIAQRYADALSTGAAALGLDVDDVPTVEVILADGPVAPMPDAPPESDGEPRRLILWTVYTPEAPGLDAEVELARALLARAYGPPPPSARFWDEGLAGYVAARSERSPDRAEAAARCRQLLMDSLLPPVEQLQVEAATRVSALVATAATAFAEYVIARYGIQRYRDLLGAARTDTPTPFDAVYRWPLTVADRDWRRSLDKAERRAESPSMWSTISRLLPLARPYWRPGLVILACTLIGIAFSLALPLSFRFLVDNILGRRPFQSGVLFVGPAGHVIGPGDEQLSALFRLLGFLGLMYVLNMLARIRQNTLLNRVGESFGFDVRCRLLDLLARLPSGYFARTTTADVNQRILADVSSIQLVVTGALIPIVAGTLSLLLYGTVLVTLEPRLAMVVLLGLPIIGGIHYSRRTKRRAASRERARRISELSGRINEFAATHVLIKIYGAAPYLIGRLNRLLEVHRTLNVEFARENSLLGQVGTLVLHLIQVGVLLVGGYIIIVSDGQALAAGGLVAFYVLMNQLFVPVGQLSTASQITAGASASVERVAELLSQEAEQEERDGVELGPLAREIRFEDVTFGYTKGRRVLKGLSLDIRAGATVAFVGPTGAGKSSVVQLLSRLYDPWGGRVTWDGVDLKTARLAPLRRQIVLVPQDPFLLNSTLYENIRFGLDGVSDEDVEAAARQAHAHEFITALSDGYDTVLGERGIVLSGGQRQRVALARALLRQPSVLVLDEATSALDATTQRVVHEGMRAAVGSDAGSETDTPRRTIIKIAHRLETVADADVIFVLDDGKVAEQGRHAELLAAGGLYARLFEDQMATLDGNKRVSRRQAIRWLARVAPFSALPPEELDRLGGALTTVERPAGETIYLQGDDSDALFIVGSGRVYVFARDDSGRERIVNTLGPGATFGVMSFLRQAPRYATMRAATDVLLFTLHASACPAGLVPPGDGTESSPSEPSPAPRPGDVSASDVPAAPDATAARA